jgi:hypothetical protein
MGPCQLGKNLQTNILGRTGSPRPGQAQQYHGSENMVALAQVPNGTLGATLEAEIYPPNFTRTSHSAG